MILVWLAELLVIQDRTSVFPKAFTELAFGLSDVLKVAPFTFYQVYKILESVIFLRKVCIANRNIGQFCLK